VCAYCVTKNVTQRSRCVSKKRNPHRTTGTIAMCSSATSRRIGSKNVKSHFYVGQLQSASPASSKKPCLCRVSRDFCSSGKKSAVRRRALQTDHIVVFRWKKFTVSNELPMSATVPHCSFHHQQAFFRISRNLSLLFVLQKQQPCTTPPIQRKLANNVLRA